MCDYGPLYTWQSSLTAYKRSSPCVKDIATVSGFQNYFWISEEGFNMSAISGFVINPPESLSQKKKQKQKKQSVVVWIQVATPLFL